MPLGAEAVHPCRDASDAVPTTVGFYLIDIVGEFYRVVFVSGDTRESHGL
jgi:hypothetical protein